MKRSLRNTTWLILALVPVMTILSACDRRDRHTPPADPPRVHLVP